MLRRTIVPRCAAAVSANLEWGRGDDRPDKRKIFSVATQHNGFEVASVTPIDDLRLVVYKFVHSSTGAILHHIDCNDKNNAFCIGFGTPATSSRGTTHVLEHTVLCGSEKYPVKDPFFHMLRRSLSTFMNAMTGADYTLYPFATTNAQDYQNLLDVYLDAVFMPLLRQDDFRQEGHRLEPIVEEHPQETLLDADGDPVARDPVRDVTGLKFNGVVFNEMLGVISEPPRHFMQTLQRVMLPGTHYEHLSGGNPPDVLNLTHEELCSYHRQHYTPWNSVAFSYGDMDPRPTLEALNRVYSGMYAELIHRGDDDEGMTSQRVTDKVPIPALTQWREHPTREVVAGPCSVMGDPAHQTKAIVSFAVPPPKGAKRLDRDTLVKLSVADTLLTDGPASPLYKKLISEGGLGQSYAPMTGFSSHYTTPLLSFGVDQVNREAVTPEKIEEAVLAGINEAIRDGFDKRRVDSTVFQTELYQRHRSANYGVNACIGLTALSLTIGGEPAEFLNWLPALRAIQADPAELQRQLEAVTKTNTHRTTLTVHADPNYSRRIEDEIAEKLRARNEEFRAAKERDELVGERLLLDHEEWLKRVQTHAPSNILPTLTVQDISKKIFTEPPMRMVHDGVELIETEANGLVYVSFLIPSRESQYDPANFDPASPHHFATMLSPVTNGLITSLGTSKYDFEEFDVESQLVASSIAFAGTRTQISDRPDDFISGTTSGFYTTVERLPAALDMVKEVMLNPRLASAMSAKERKHLLNMVCARAAAKADGLQQNGHRIALLRSYMNTSFAAGLGDAFSGLGQTQFLEKLQKRLTSSDSAVVQQALDEILQARDTRILDLPRRANELGVDVWAVCDGKNSEAVGEGLRDFRRAISGDTKVVNATPRVLNIDWKPKPQPAKDEEAASVTSLPINASYAASAFVHGLPYMSKEQQALRLALQLAKSEFLHREVRELGGSYGVMTEATLNGIAGGIAIASYRDPTPDRSLGVFAKVGDWLSSRDNVTQQRLDEAKLRLFASIDHPITCDSYGVRRRMSGMTDETEQRIRDMLLEVNVDDIISVAAQAFPAESQRTAVLSPVQKHGHDQSPAAESE